MNMPRSRENPALDPKFKVIETDANKGNDAQLHPAFNYPSGLCRLR